MLERALESASLEDRRLVLVRRGPSLPIRTGQTGPSARSATAAALAESFSRAMEPVLAGAIHGGSSAAGSAGAVWFTDRYEALACYLALLARGRRPNGWFWQAALPTGYRAEKPDSVAQQLIDALAGGGEASATSIRVFRAASQRAPVSALLSLFDRFRLPAVWANVIPTGTEVHVTTGEAPKKGHRSSPPPYQTYQSPSLEHSLARFPEFAAPVRSLDPARAPGQLAICLGVLFGLSRPDLAVRAGETGAAIARWTAALTPPTRDCDSGPQASVFPSSQPTEKHPSAEQNDDRHPLVEREGSEPEPPIKQTDTIEEQSQPRSDDRSTNDENERAIGQYFPGTGLLLAIPALARLGFPEWLEAQSDLLRQDTARQLILHLFGCYAPKGLPVAALLLTGNRRVPHGPPAPQLHAACAIWRKGLDGWLRRSADCRLHDLASREGWLHAGVERSFVAFPLQSIHLGLRRRALDVDPGWVPWLGISLRYIFAERPEDPAVAG